MAWLRKVSEVVFGKQAVQSVSNWMPQPSQDQIYYQKNKEYIAREAAVGARILGPIPSGHDREFFCLDENTWIWHETWKDQNGRHQFTVNYEIDPSGVLKRVNGGPYVLLQGEELRRFDKATEAYLKEVSRHVYGQPIVTQA